MTEQHRIGLLYSYGPHFKQAARALRTRYPGSRITALLPPGYPEAVIRDVVDDIIICAPEPEYGKTPGQAWRLIKTLRRERYDVLVVLFDSLKLQLIAAMSGAGERCCHHLDNRYEPLRLSLFGAIAAGLVRHVRGRLRYMRIWWHVYRHPIRPTAPDKDKTNTKESS